MVSIIICSRHSYLSKEMTENISSTIGIEYEIIIIDNSSNRYSIFEAYNLGVSRAIYPYLCFMHDDILYHTQDWGIKVINHFQRNIKLGLIGVVGGHYIPDTPSTWYSTDYCSGKILQGHKDGNGNYSVFEDKRKIVNNDYSIEVVAVDGLWFCIPKHLFDRISFDNKIFKGWHAYDIDICLQIIEAGFEVRVIEDVLIEHSSYGNSGFGFYSEMKKFNKKWKRRLPIIRGIEITKDEQESAYLKTKEEFNYHYKRTFKFYRVYKQCCMYISALKNRIRIKSNLKN